LLQDPGEAVATNQQGVPVEISYPVRRAAYDALLNLGQTPARPLSSRRPTEEETRKARQRTQK
jgi:hypothetical protein